MIDVHCSDVREILKLPEDIQIISRKDANTFVRIYKQQHCCEKCGSRRNLVFHHKDPNEKFMEISDMVNANRKIIIGGKLCSTRRIPIWSLKREMNKCILLCDKCHKLEHNKNKKEKEK